MPNVNFYSDWQAQQEDIERRRKLADLLKKESMSPMQQFSGGGVVARNSPWEALSKVGNNYFAGEMQKNATADQRRITGEMTSKRGETLAQMIEQLRSDPGGADVPATGGEGDWYPQKTAPKQPDYKGAAMTGMQSGDPVLGQVGGAALAKLLTQKETKWEVKDRFNPQTGRQEKMLVDLKNPEHVIPFGGQEMPKMQAVEAAGQGGAPETRFVDPNAQTSPIPKPVSQQIGPGGQLANTFTGKVSGALQDPNKPFNFGPGGEQVPNAAFQNYEQRIPQGNLDVARGNLANSQQNTYFNTGMRPGGGQQPPQQPQMPPPQRAMPNSALPQSPAGQITGIPQNEIAQARAAGINVNQGPQGVPPAMQQGQVTPKALAEREADRPMAQARLNEITASLTQLQTAADSLKTHPGMEGTWSATGATGVVAGRIPGTEPYNATARLETLKNQIALSALQKMREDSKTGGALGNVSNYEDAMLANSVSSLQNAQSTKQIMQSLDEVSKWSKAAVDRRHQAFSMMYPNAGDQQRGGGATGDFGGGASQGRVRRFNPATERIE